MSDCEKCKQLEKELAEAMFMLMNQSGVARLEVISGTATLKLTNDLRPGHYSISAGDILNIETAKVQQ